MAMMAPHVWSLLKLALFVWLVTRHDTSWQRWFGTMALALAYLVMPFDLIPDFLVLLGVVDDVLIVGWLLNRVDTQLADYRAWKSATEAATASSRTPS